MTHREHLAEADRFIAECKDRIARQRKIIATAYENGHPTVLPVSLLRVLEENLRSFEKYRLLILDQQKNTGRMTGKNRIRNTWPRTIQKNWHARLCDRGCGTASGRLSL